MLTSAFEVTCLRHFNGNYVVVTSEKEVGRAENKVSSSYNVESGNVVDSVAGDLILTSQTSFNALNFRNEMSGTTLKFEVDRSMDVIDSIVKNSRKIQFRNSSLFYPTVKASKIQVETTAVSTQGKLGEQGSITKSFMHRNKDALNPKRKYTKRKPKAKSVLGVVIDLSKPRGGRGAHKRRKLGNNSEEEKFRAGLDQVLELSKSPQGYQYIDDESRRVNVFGVQCRVRKRETALFSCVIQVKNCTTVTKFVGLLWQKQENPQKAVVLTFRKKTCEGICACDHQIPIDERIELTCSCETFLNNRKRMNRKCEHVKLCAQHESFFKMVDSLLECDNGESLLNTKSPSHLWAKNVRPTVVDSMEPKSLKSICWEVERFVKGKEVIITRNKHGINRSWNYWIVMDTKDLAFVPILRKYGRPLRCYHCIADASFRGQCEHEKACAMTLSKSGAILHDNDEPKRSTADKSKKHDEDEWKIDKELNVYADNRIMRPPLPCEFDNACTLAITRILDRRGSLHLFVVEDPIGIKCRKCENTKTKPGVGRSRTNVAFYTVADGCVNCVVIDWICEKCHHLNVYRGEHHGIFPARKYIMYSTEFLYILVLKSCFGGESFRKSFQSAKIFWDCTSVQEKFRSKKVLRMDWNLPRLRRTANEAFRIFISRIDVDEKSISGLMFSCKKCETSLNPQDRMIFNLSEEAAKGMKRLRGIVVDGTCCGILRELPPHDKKEAEVRKPTEIRKKVLVGTNSKSTITKLFNLCRLACRETERMGLKEFSAIQNVVTNKSLQNREKARANLGLPGKRVRGRVQRGNSASGRGAGQRGNNASALSSVSRGVSKRGRPRGRPRGSRSVKQIQGRGAAGRGAARGSNSGINDERARASLESTNTTRTSEVSFNFCTVNLSYTQVASGSEKREMTADEIALLRYYDDKNVCFDSRSSEESALSTTVRGKCSHESCENRRKAFASGKGVEQVRHVLAALFNIRMGSREEAKCVKDPSLVNLNDRAQESTTRRYLRHQNVSDVDLIDRIDLMVVEELNRKSTNSVDEDEHEDEHKGEEMGAGKAKTGKSKTSGKKGQSDACWIASLQDNAAGMSTIVDSCLELLELLLVDNACGMYLHYSKTSTPEQVAKLYSNGHLTRDIEKLSAGAITVVKQLREQMSSFSVCECGGTHIDSWPCDGCCEKLEACAENIGDNQVSIRRFLVEVLKSGHKNVTLSKKMINVVNYMLGEQLEVASNFLKHLHKNLHKTAASYWKQFGKFPIKPIESGQAKDGGNSIDRGCTFGRFPGREMHRLPICFEESEKLHCNKNYSESQTHSHGIVTVQCACDFPKMLGFFLLRKPESTAIALCCIIVFFNLPPEIVYYDNGCNLFSGILHRLPWLLYLVRVLVDMFHSQSHVCSSFYRSNWYEESETARTTAAESHNSRHQSISYFAQYLAGENFVPYLVLRCALLNFATVLRENGLNGEINDIDIRQKFREEHKCTCVHCVGATFSRNMYILETDLLKSFYPVDISPDMLDDERRKEVFGEEQESSGRQGSENDSDSEVNDSAVSDRATRSQDEGMGTETGSENGDVELASRA